MEETKQLMEAYTKEQVIDGYTKETIIDMSKKVLEHLAKKYSKVREGVGAIMGDSRRNGFGCVKTMEQIGIKGETLEQFEEDVLPLTQV